MKVKDYVIFGSNATAALGAGNTEAITWEADNEQYYEIDTNEAVELIQLGIQPDSNALQTFVRNRDNTEWIPDGFFTAGVSTGYGLNELPYQHSPDFSKIQAPVTPDVTVRRPPTLKLQQGERLKVLKKNNWVNASVSVSHAVGVVRKYTAQNPTELGIVQGFNKEFGGLESNAQLYHMAGYVTAQSANGWYDILTLTLLKRELYAFNKIGVHLGGNALAAGEIDKTRIFIDEQIEFNKYPVSATAAGAYNYNNLLPFQDDIYDPGMAGTVGGGGYVTQKMYKFAQPLVVSKDVNKKLQFQGYGTAALSITAPDGIFARMLGMKYKLG